MTEQQSEIHKLRVRVRRLEEREETLIAALYSFASVVQLSESDDLRKAGDDLVEVVREFTPRREG